MSVSSSSAIPSVVISEVTGKQVLASALSPQQVVISEVAHVAMNQAGQKASAASRSAETEKSAKADSPIAFTRMTVYQEARQLIEKQMVAETFEAIIRSSKETVMADVIGPFMDDFFSIIVGLKRISDFRIIAAERIADFGSKLGALKENAQYEYFLQSPAKYVLNVLQKQIGSQVIKAVAVDHLIRVVVERLVQAKCLKAAMVCIKVVSDKQAIEPYFYDAIRSIELVDFDDFSMMRRYALEEVENVDCRYGILCHAIITPLLNSCGDDNKDLVKLAEIFEAIRGLPIEGPKWMVDFRQVALRKLCEHYCKAVERIGFAKVDKYIKGNDLISLDGVEAGRVIRSIADGLRISDVFHIGPRLSSYQCGPASTRVIRKKIDELVSAEVFGEIAEIPEAVRKDDVKLFTEITQNWKPWGYRMYEPLIELLGYVTEGESIKLIDRIYDGAEMCARVSHKKNDIREVRQAFLKVSESFKKVQWPSETQGKHAEEREKKMKGLVLELTKRPVEKSAK